MNLLHLKYAVEIERTGSISKAAERLFMGQPHLSKAIKELEDSLGIAIFNRTSKGVVPTERGAEFLKYANDILARIDEMESVYKPSDEKQKFTVSVPRAGYISYAFAEFVKALDPNRKISLDYRETNSIRAIKNVESSINDVAVIRYQSIYESYFLGHLAEKDLKHEEIWEFEYVALMSDKHPLAVKSEVAFNDFDEYIEIIYGDVSVPSLPIAEVRKLSALNGERKIIAVYERGSQLELLSKLPTAYMRSSPMPADELGRYSLVQKPCKDVKNKYKDVLIYRNNYRPHKNEELFIKKLKETVEKIRRA
ncbi:MAG: LysR family transcriptional regulator [Clostridiales bacterium]|nr:LysR family transcriptional regulator [Clostridiales bacterium]